MPAWTAPLGGAADRRRFEVAEKKIAPKKADTSKDAKKSDKAQTRVTKKVARKVSAKRMRVQ
jgi:hypothetical protein